MICTDTQSYSYWQLFLPLGYGSLSILLYILLSVVILRRKKLHQPFYYYFIFLSIMNSVLWIDLFVLNRLNRVPDLCSFLLTTLADSSVLLNLTVILFTITSVGQLLIMMLISLSRFLAVVWPTKTVLPSPSKAIIGILIVSLLTSSIVFSWTARYVAGPDGTPLFMTDQGWPYISPVYIISPIGTICSIFVPTSTIYAVWLLVKNKKQKKNYVEMKLLLTSLCFSLSSICLSVYMMGIFFGRYILNDNGVIEKFNNYREILLDLATLPAGWLLLLTNKDIRTAATRKKLFLSSQSTP